MKKYDIIACGSATVDVFAETDAELIKIIASDHYEELVAYPAGDKILIKRLHFDIGGGGTNTAVTFARMGLKTAYLGCLGNDENADIILERLKKHSIDFIGYKAKAMTNYSVILDSKADDRTILAFKDASDKLDFAKINKKNLNAEWVYFSSLMGKAFATMVRLCKFLKRKGARIAFNPSSYQAKMGVSKLMPVLKHLDLLVLNKEEAQLLLGYGHNNAVKDEKALLLELNRLGISIVIITDGSKGAYCFHDNLVYFLKANKVKVVETTGAGDAFASGFVAGYIKTNSIEKAMHIAMANATSVIMHLGAKNNILSYRQALAFARKNHKIRKFKANI